MIVLASSSARRIQMLKEIFGKFLIVDPANINEEEIIFSGDLNKYLKTLSFLKADKIAKKYNDLYVIGADTIVYIDGKVIGKPKDDIEAFEILNLLSGRVHQVYTGVTLINKKLNFYDFFLEKTDIKFFNLSKEEIKNYISLKDYKDKAGGYGIQSVSKLFIEKIDGDFYNVVGFPIGRFYHRYKEIIKNILKQGYQTYAENK